MAHIGECARRELRHPVPEPEAWAEFGVKGEGIVVGHPDTGYTRHAEIWDTPSRIRIADSYDFVLRRPDAVDPLERGNPGHGTTTASVIMSSTGGAGATFVSGVAPAATLIPLRVTPRVVLVGFDRLAEAIRYATDRGCHVISMSLGGGFFLGLEEAIDCAVRQGLIVMAAAGNYSPFVVWPARYPDCIAVAATNADDAPWTFSSRGGKVAVSAPGESVWTATFDLDRTPPTPYLDRHNGTSFAVAHLAGVTALWLAHHGRDNLLGMYGPARLQAGSGAPPPAPSAGADCGKAASRPDRPGPPRTSPPSRSSAGSRRPPRRTAPPGPAAPRAVPPPARAAPPPPNSATSPRCGS